MRRGFTLIELLISITVISLFAGIAFANYSRTNQHQTLISTGQNLKNILRDVQSRAYTGEIDCTVCDCGTGSSNTSTGWYVDLDNRTFYGECGGNQFSSMPFTFPDNINVNLNLSEAGPLVFRHYPLGVSANGTICLAHADLADTYYSVTIDSSGNISDSGGIITSCP